MQCESKMADLESLFSLGDCLLWNGTLTVPFTSTSMSNVVDYRRISLNALPLPVPLDWDLKVLRQPCL